MTFTAYRITWQAILALSVVGIGWISATPAQAQLSPGCTCPAGSVPTLANMCFQTGPVPVTFPATCPVAPTNQSVPANSLTRAINQSIGRLAASQQQISFAGVQTMLQTRRDQLQSAPASSASSSASNSSAAVYSLVEPYEIANTFGPLTFAAQSQRSASIASTADTAQSVPAITGPNWGVWAQGLGDWQRNDPVTPADVGRFTSTYGPQAGVDAMWRNVIKSGDAMVLGLVGSWSGSLTSFDGTPTTMQMNSPGVGLYSMYLNGNFSVDLTPKFDFPQMNQYFAGAAPDTSLNMTNAGVSGNVQYKIKLGNGNFIEPTTGFSYSRTMVGSGGAALGLVDSSNMRVQGGGRWGTSWDFKGDTLATSLKVLAYDAAVVDNSSIAPSTVPSDQGTVRWEFDPNISWTFANGYSLSLSGSVRFGASLTGGSASLNLRKQW